MQTQTLSNDQEVESANWTLNKSEKQCSSENDANPQCDGGDFTEPSNQNRQSPNERRRDNQRATCKTQGDYCSESCHQSVCRRELQPGRTADHLVDPSGGSNSSTQSGQTVKFEQSRGPTLKKKTFLLIDQWTSLNRPTQVWLQERIWNMRYIIQAALALPCGLNIMTLKTRIGPWAIVWHW